MKIEARIIIDDLVKSILGHVGPLRPKPPPPATYQEGSLQFVHPVDPNEENWLEFDRLWSQQEEQFVQEVLPRKSIDNPLLTKLRIIGIFNLRK